MGIRAWEEKGNGGPEGRERRASEWRGMKASIIMNRKESKGRRWKESIRREG
jgi:hypothetical protein